ncbi:PH domain-containing protein [Patescibacteria group bacterium]
MQDAAHYFPNQRPDERIIVFMRRHWTVFLGHVTFTVILAVLFTALIFALGYFFPELAREETGRIIQLLSVMFLMFLFLFLFIGWIDYYLDVFIVTTSRVVQIKQNALFNRSVSELSLTEIQDVSTKIVGVIPTFMQFGTLLIQTAAAVELFQFLKLSHPEKISDIIIHLRDQYNRHGEKELQNMYRSWENVRGRTLELDNIIQIVRQQSQTGVPQHPTTPSATQTNTDHQQ